MLTVWLVLKLKGCENECFRVDSGVRLVSIISPCFFNAYTDAVMKKLKIGMGRRGMRFQEEGREWRLPGLLYTDNLFLCGESEEDLRTMVGRCIEVCRRRCLIVNASKSKVILLGGDEGLEHVLEFKYLGCVLDESGTYEVACSRKVPIGRRVAGAIRSLVNAESAASVS